MEIKAWEGGREGEGEKGVGEGQKREARRRRDRETEKMVGAVPRHHAQITMPSQTHH